MMDSENVPIARACKIIGNEVVLRSVMTVLDNNVAADLLSSAVKSWLFEASSDAEIVAKVLCDQVIRRAVTLDAESQVVSPDFVPNKIGDDPWLLAWRRLHEGENGDLPLYLACFCWRAQWGIDRAAKPNCLVLHLMPCIPQRLGQQFQTRLGSCSMIACHVPTIGSIGTAAKGFGLAWPMFSSKGGYRRPPSLR